METAGVAGDVADAVVARSALRRDSPQMTGRFEAECWDAKGHLRWRGSMRNMIVNQGLQHTLDAVFSGSSQVSTWYVGLCATSPTVASSDTAAVHGGWAEFTSYGEETRPEWVEVRTNQSMTNSASKAAFSINVNASVIGGLFLTSVAAKSAGTGTLMSAVAFSGGNKSADSGDTLSVTYTLSLADDGV